MMGSAQSPSLALTEGDLPTQQKYHGKRDELAYDPEAQEEVPLVPGLSKMDNALRWGFIKKVYGIMSAQLFLTALVAAVIMFNEPVQRFVMGSMAFQITCAVLPLVGLIPLFIYSRKHPHNLIILGLWTAAMSVGVGTACTLYEPFVVLEALALTASVTTSLTAYTFYAARKGQSFQKLGPMLFTCLWAFVAWSFLQIVFPMPPVGKTIFALLGAVLFSLYIIYDTEQLISRHDLDDYVIASLSLYLDIINLFLKLLQLLGNNRQ
ncbi:hypothetical protein WJX81_007898 [Elliptochloris bilobata]|uniref:Uncharacterized protein n=1 Tax=Elliptochloris bilobata TaxID=381761 RepID=A0AAW1RQ34_9CHLO